MEWNRIKSGLIILLIAANLILGYNMVARLSERGAAERSSVAQACATLSKAGITVPEDQILSFPGTVSAYAAVREEPTEKAIAEQFIGKSASSFPGGGIAIYTGEYGKVSFHTGGLINVELNKAPKDNESVRRFFENLISDAGMGNYVCTGESDEKTVIFTGLCDKRPLQNATLTCTVSDTGAKISGKWVLGQMLLDGQSLPKAEIIISLRPLLEQAGITHITDASMIYIMQENAQRGVVQVVPVWKLIYDKGEIYVNALTKKQMLL